MSTGSSKTRTKRLASIAAVHTSLQQIVTHLLKKSSIICFLIFSVSFLLFILIHRIWNPPFPYYEGMALNRDIVARVGFETIDTAETDNERNLARNRVPNVYILNDSPDLLKENIGNIYKLLKEASDPENWEQNPDLQQQFRIPDMTEEEGKGLIDIWQFLRNTPEPPKETVKSASGEGNPPEEKPASGDDSQTEPEAEPENSDGTLEPALESVPKEEQTDQAVSHTVRKISPEMIQTTSSSTQVVQLENAPNLEDPANTAGTANTANSANPAVEDVSMGETKAKEETKLGPEAEKAKELELEREKRLREFCDKLEEVMSQFTSQGLMHIAEVREDPLGRGLQIQISIVRSDNSEEEGQRTLLKSVILEDNEQIHKAIQNIAETPHIGSQIYYCICRNWKSNLLYDSTLTNQAIQAAIQNISPVKKYYQATQRIVQMQMKNDVLIGTLLKDDHIHLLKIENEKWSSERTLKEKIRYGVSTSFFLLLCLIPAWTYIILMEPRIIHEFSRLIFIMAFFLITLFLATWFSQMPTMPRSFGLFPLMIFSQVLTIQYRRRIGILFVGVMILCMAVTLNMTNLEILCDGGILLVAILPFDRLRGRLQFIRISVLAAIVAFLLFTTSNLMVGVPFSIEILRHAVLGSLPLILAGLVIQSFLPLLERWLGILSDVRLMELCDVSNPLLNELVSRAPSTYSHSISLGTLGETAADAIGCNGLLVRTAAYYHDIGKIYKPSYYAENQIDKEKSPHNSLEPSMSALIIIAHVKNGVDLAHQYKLPQQIIDLIEQHHGSGLVSYFYRQAQKRHLEDPTIPEPEEMSFRYPCPKPQTKEAVVLMMADACESASRSLVEPTPARIQNLVRSISQERLEDEQFDESGITLTELRTIEASIVKGLISLHHGRVKYPDKIEKKR